MSNSSLVVYTSLSPNHSGKRTHTIDRITPHCVVGQLSAESICGCFISPSKGASCNYAIGTDGRVALCVDENNRSWCSSSNTNDQRAVTIECASDKATPYTMNSSVYNSLVALCTDICKRNGKNKLIWISDKEKSLAYEPKSGEMVLTVHRWFANKSCPGDWLYSRLGDLASKVTANLSSSTNSTTKNLYRVQVGAYSNKDSADAMLAKLKAAGFAGYIVTEQATSTTTKAEIKVGSTVRVKKGAKTYSGGEVASFVYERDHKVTEIKNDRAVISYNNYVVAAVKITDLTLV